MKTYYGTKLIKAHAMNRADYNTLRGWNLPADENGADEGYLVEYLDGGKPNVEGYNGYISWSPKEQFEAAYQPTDALSFGHAVEALKAGKKVARAGWNGKGMWLYLVPANSYPAQTPAAKAYWGAKAGHLHMISPANADIDKIKNAKPGEVIQVEGMLHAVAVPLVPYGAYIAMKTAQENVVPWLASQTDVLADDWQIVE